MHRLTTLMTFLLIALHAAIAQPCWCTHPKHETKQQLVKGYDLIFTGKVVSIRGIEIDGVVFYVEVELRVSSVWVGDIKPTIHVRTIAKGAACGYGFQIGKEYLVFARTKNELHSTSQCSSTVPINEAKHKLSLLGEPVFQFPRNPTEMRAPRVTKITKLESLTPGAMDQNRCAILTIDLQVRPPTPGELRCLGYHYF